MDPADDCECYEEESPHIDPSFKNEPLIAAIQSLDPEGGAPNMDVLLLAELENLPFAAKKEEIGKQLKELKIEFQNMKLIEDPKTKKLRKVEVIVKGTPMALKLLGCDEENFLGRTLRVKFADFVYDSELNTYSYESQIRPEPKKLLVSEPSKPVKEEIKKAEGMYEIGDISDVSNVCIEFDIGCSGSSSSRTTI